MHSNKNLIKEIGNWENITELAIEKKWPVAGLNIISNKEIFEILQYSTYSNGLRGTCIVSHHLFENEKLVHLPMTMGMRIIVNLIKIYLNNKYNASNVFFRIVSYELISAKILRNFDKFEVDFKEKNYTEKLHQSVFLVNLAENTLVYRIVVEHRENNIRGILSATDNNIDYNETLIKIFSLHIRANQLKLITEIWDKKNVIDLFDFSIFYNILTNAAFIYASWENNISGKNRFIFAKKQKFFSNKNTVIQLTNPFYLSVLNKREIDNNIFYKVVFYDEIQSFELNVFYCFVMSNT